MKTSNIIQNRNCIPEETMPQSRSTWLRIPANTCPKDKQDITSIGWPAAEKLRPALTWLLYLNWILNWHQKPFESYLNPWYFNENTHTCKRYALEIDERDILMKHYHFYSYKEKQERKQFCYGELLSEYFHVCCNALY